MAEVWVANASPIIVLAKGGYLDLFTKLAGEILLPQAVVDEILAGPPADPARRAFEAGWGTHVTSQHVAPELLEWGLGPGETAVLALAQERAPAIAVLDDAAARSCARVLGVPVIGTLGVIARAKTNGILPSAAAVMKTLRDVGLYVDDETIGRMLRHIGEDWPRR